MTVWSASSVVLWLALSGASLGVWRPQARESRGFQLTLSRTTALVAVVAVQASVTAVVAVLANVDGPVRGLWFWLVIGAALAAALLSGGAMVTTVLALADASARPAARVQRTILRGGTWIGALERLGLVATVLAGWPEGVAVIVAVKGLARYPELKVGQNSGAAERFIIGTFTSLGWAAVCAGIAHLLLR